MVKKHKYDLGWGESVCVREVLNRYYKPSLIPPDLLSMGYSPDAGDPKLIELIDDYLIETTGKSYKHIIVTTGTVQSINVVLRVLKRHEGIESASTSNHFFPWYPNIISKNDIVHRKTLSGHPKNNVNLIDMPSNATGNMSQTYFDPDSTIWDSVYYNPVFVNSPRMRVQPHRVNVGSFSKSFGLTGLRIGYIATNDPIDYERYLSENLYEAGTVSALGQNMASDILENLDRHLFFKEAKLKINNNRESMNKINHLFDGQEVQNNGMFYSVYSEDKALEILEKASVKYVVLSNDGYRKFIRFNLGQNNSITKSAVEAILKVDRKRIV